LLAYDVLNCSGHQQALSISGMSVGWRRIQLNGMAKDFSWQAPR